MSSEQGTAFRTLLVLLAATILPVAGCGGDSGSEEGGGSASEEGGGSTDLTVAGAEDTVRLYLAAVAEGEGEVACGLLADDFEAKLLEVGQARGLGAETCPDYFAELAESHAQAGEPFAFEGQPIREADDAQALEFSTEVEQKLGEASGTSATVRGEQGTIAYQLDAPSGAWEITRITEGG